MIDLDRVLAPISSDAPSGKNLRFVPGDTTISSLDEMRRQEDPELDPAGKGKNADWKGVVSNSQSALAEKTKDLQIAAYLAEGLTRTQGFDGLRQGLNVLRELLGRYWDGLHPGFEDGEIVAGVRAKWLSWVGSSNDFRMAVRRVPMTGSTAGAARSWFDYEESRRVDQAALMTDKAAFNELVQTGRISGEEWRGALDSTPPAQLQAILDGVRGSSEELAELSRVCDEKFGDDAPSLLPLAELLRECQEYFERILQGGAASVEREDGAAPGMPAAARATGPISTRDQAYAHLREVADYLRRTEPHSPVSYLIDRAVRWGRLPFQDLLRDVLKHNEDARTTVLETLGLAEPEE
ncbi:MAG TPA: type VI secretion system protein TssA [bacterium]|nr:type VI secretion system protein TssA [bacterium]